MAGNSEFGEKVKGALNLGLGGLEVAGGIKFGAKTLTDIATAPLQPAEKAVTLQGPEAAQGLGGMLHAVDTALTHAPNGLLGAVVTLAVTGEGFRRIVQGVDKLR